jgi:hypothetical protein
LLGEAHLQNGGVKCPTIVRVHFAGISTMTARYRDIFKKASESGCTSTTVAFPDPISYSIQMN